MLPLLLVVACGAAVLRAEKGAQQQPLQPLPDICGIYQNTSGDSRIEIYHASEQVWQARAVWSSEYGDVEERNIVVLRQLVYDSGDDKWTGKVYNPFNNKCYNATVEREADGSLKVTGRKGIISRSMIWLRIGN